VCIDLTRDLTVTITVANPDDDFECRFDPAGQIVGGGGDVRSVLIRAVRSGLLTICSWLVDNGVIPKPVDNAIAVADGMIKG
jgi:hypothetical protein